MLDLIAEQARLEERMASLGVDRYRAQALDNRQNGVATETRAVGYALDAAIAPMVGALAAFRADALTGKAGRRHSAVKGIEGLPDEAVAFVTAKVVLDGVAKDRDLTGIAYLIGGVIEVEKRAALYRTTHAAHLGTVEKDLNRRTRNERHRKGVINHVLSEAGDGWAEWSARDRVLIGTKLVELFVSSTGLFDIEYVRRGRNKTAATVLPTTRLNDWLAQLDLQAEVLSPEFLPCVIPPKAWDGLTGAGYHTDAFAFDLSLVKTRNRKHLAELKKADLSKVFKAVNAIQETPWAINRRVLEVATAIKTGLAGLPSMEDEPLPSKPLDIDTNEEARTAWKRVAATVYSANRTMFSRRVQTLKTLSVAKEFSTYDAIYFPHQLDFRGRVYAVPAALNPQGTDLAKGLLQFATGDPIVTPEQHHWFLIHGANCFGVDKVSFPDRVQWVEDNWRRIRNTALNPLEDLWWTEADSPFCFLAWCFEYLDNLDAQGAGRPLTSRIAIAMDGSCNGLQHYSAMLRDPVAGRAVNLVPSGTPKDIYGVVADTVMGRLKEIARGEDEAEAKMAYAWRHVGIDRKITKRPVMVLPYGGTLNSCMNYVFEAVQSRDTPFSPEDLRPAANWLSGKVWSGIGEVVVSARLAMGWLREASGAVSRAGHALKWTTPSGFVVMQSYEQVRTRQIDTVLFGQRFQPSLQENIPGSLDRRRQSNGVAPNFVHSLDAAALILTVCAAVDRGVTKFAMIHDSYGTTAAFTPVMASALRDEFVRMYEEHDMLEEFREEAVPADIRDAVSLPPTVGGLDLSQVRESEYFFA